MSKYVRKYHRGARITSLDELLEQEAVYMSAYDNRLKNIEVVKCMTLKTVLIFLNSGSIFKAVKGEGPDEVTAMVKPLEGQTNIFGGTDE